MSYKDWRYCILVSIYVVGQYLLPLLVHSIILFTAVVLYMRSINFVLNKRALFLVMPFIFLLPIGLISAWRWEARDVFRDWWYVINPILALLAGAFFSEKNQGDISIILKAILVSGIVFSIFHFIEILRHLPELENRVDLRGVRASRARTGSILPVLAVSVLLYSEFNRFVRWDMKTKIIIFIICMASFVFSFSRSWTVAFVILSVTLLLLKIKRRRSIFIFVGMAALLMAYYVIDVTIADQGYCTGFFCGISKSVREVLPRDYFFMRDLSQYWRGYETYMAIQQYKDGNAFELFFGQGLGVLVDLNVSVVLGSAAYDKIPIMHNGYAYILVKFGLAGLFIYIAQCLRYFTLGLNAFGDTSYEQRLIGAYIMALSVTILLLTFVNAGIFNKNSMIPALFFIAAFIRARFYMLDKLTKSY